MSNDAYKNSKKYAIFTRNCYFDGGITQDDMLVIYMRVHDKDTIIQTLDPDGKYALDIVALPEGDFLHDHYGVDYAIVQH